MDIGRYRLLSRIGRGGMAEVYRALAIGPGGFQKEVVVKRILPDLSVEPSFADMFLDEARIASRLDHPNIVQIHDLGCVDETYFIVMELVRGMDLSALVAALAPGSAGTPPLEVAVALRIVGDVCRALDYAHRTTASDGSPLGLVHRDVSPQNVLVSDEGTVKLADFGIARAMQGEMRRTLRGLIRGKARYMSPEQALGMPLDARSDVYAAGIVLYELLTHRHPYAPRGLRDATGFSETLVRAATPVIDPPSSWAPLDAELDALVMHALAPSPDARFSSAAALLEAIETYLHDARLRVGPAEIARCVRRARQTEPARVISIDAALAGELGGDAALGELEVTAGTNRTGLPVYRSTGGPARDATTLDEPMPAIGSQGAAAPRFAGLARRVTATAALASPNEANSDAMAVAPTTAPLADAASGSPARALDADAASPLDGDAVPGLRQPAPRVRLGRPVQVAAVLLALAVGSAITMVVLGRDGAGPVDAPTGERSWAARDAAPSVGDRVVRPVSRTVVPSIDAFDAGHGETDASDVARVAADDAASSVRSSLPSEPRVPTIRRPERERDTRPARLDIGARPNWASVTVDGRAVGTTPCSTTLPPGSYTVIARNPGLGLQQRRRVRLSPGGHHRVVFDPF